MKNRDLSERLEKSVCAWCSGPLLRNTGVKVEELFGPGEEPLVVYYCGYACVAQAAMGDAQDSLGNILYPKDDGDRMQETIEYFYRIGDGELAHFAADQFVRVQENRNAHTGLTVRLLEKMIAGEGDVGIDDR